MKFEKVTVFGQPYWFSTIYKIVGYEWSNSEPSKIYYHAYYIQPDAYHWGNYVRGKKAQEGERLTFKQVVALCVEHSKSYVPTTKQLKRAEIAKASWIDRGLKYDSVTSK